MTFCSNKVTDVDMNQAHIVFLSHIMAAFSTLEDISDFVNIRIKHKRLRVHAFCWSNITTYAEFYELDNAAQLGQKLGQLDKDMIKLLLEQLKGTKHD